MEFVNQCPVKNQVIAIQAKSVGGNQEEKDPESVFLPHAGKVDYPSYHQYLTNRIIIEKLRIFNF